MTRAGFRVWERVRSTLSFSTMAPGVFIRIPVHIILSFFSLPYFFLDAWYCTWPRNG